jgi:toxin ParE1/3/4
VYLEWSDRSLFDLQTIQTFIAQDSVTEAAGFINELVHATDILSFSPTIGRKVPEIADESIRELVFRNYRIVYKKGDEIISILTVFEGHKLLDY